MKHKLKLNAREVELKRCTTPFCYTLRHLKLTKNLRFKAFALSLIAFLGVSIQVDAQTTYPVISQNWSQIYEDESVMMEISVQVIQCDSSSSHEVFVEVFNETPNNDTAQFKLVMTNPQNNNKETKNISFYIQGSRIEKPECGSNDNSALRFSVPSGWDPEDVEFSVTYLN